MLRHCGLLSIAPGTRTSVATTLDACLALPATHRLDIRRWRKHPIPNRPARASWERLKLLEISAPVYPVDHATTEHLWMDCPRHAEVLSQSAESSQLIELDALYAKELKSLLQSSSMIGLYHLNVADFFEERKAWQNARRLGLEMKKYSARVCNNVLRDTKWHNLLHFVESGLTDQVFVFSNHKQFISLLDYEKKVPHYLFLAAVVEDRILDRAGVQRASSLPPLDVLRGQFCSILQMPAQKTVGLMGHHQTKLSTLLQQYLKDKQ